MHFTTFEGQRTAFMCSIFWMHQTFLRLRSRSSTELNAGVEIAPAMNGDDLQKGLSQVG
jgi:hypothetical protein